MCNERARERSDQASVANRPKGEQSKAKQSFKTQDLALLDFTTRTLHFIRDDYDFILLAFQDLSC